jgi:enoyl-CoA hydratase
MSGSSFVLLYEKRGAIALVTLNRPAARNAITPEMACRMADAFADASADDAVRVVILTGAGDKAFCSGGDLGRMLPLMTGAREPEDEWDRRVLDDPAVMARSSLRGYAFDKPVVAAINGACLAGGMETVLATDIRIAAEHATFGLPEVKRALIPFAGSLVRLPRQVAYCHAMELLLTGDAIDAAEALRMGLVNRVVPAPEVMPQALEVARRIAANGPVAIRQVKRTVRDSSGLSLAEGYRMEDEANRLVMATNDAREGPRAFMEKRPPVYTAT